MRLGRVFIEPGHTGSGGKQAAAAAVPKHRMAPPKQQQNKCGWKLEKDERKEGKLLTTHTDVLSYGRFAKNSKKLFGARAEQNRFNLLVTLGKA
jgi:hypothetical protein